MDRLRSAWPSGPILPACSGCFASTEQKRPQINFVGFSWEDPKNPIASVVLFPPEEPVDPAAAAAAATAAITAPEDASA